MALKCSACTSLGRATIDADLARGLSLRDIARTSGVNKSTLDRHRRLHIARDLAAAVEAGAVQRGSALANQLADLVADARKIQAEAEKGKDARTGLLAIRELTRLVELGAKLSGELTSRHSVTVTVQQTMSEGEALEVARDCLLALATPDQQRQLAAELLARAGEDDRLLLQGEATGNAPVAPSQVLDPQGDN